MTPRSRVIRLALAAVLLTATASTAGVVSALASEGAVDGQAQAAQDLGALLDRAEPGQRVVIPPGTYRGPVVIDTPVVLEPRGDVEVVGDGTGTVLTVRAPGTVVRGITVRGSGPGPTGNPAAIRVEADGVTIEGVRVEDSYIGIAVEEVEGVRLVDNTIVGRAGAAIVDEGHAVDHDRGDDDPGAGTIGGDADGTGHRARGDGIWLHDAEHVLVRGNTITSSRDGVYVSFGTDTLIDGNEVRDSRYAVHTMYTRQLTLVENRFLDNLSGAVLMYRGPALVLRNHIEGSRSPSTGFALLLKDVVGVEAVENVLVRNRVGLHLDGPTGDDPAKLSRNTIAHNAIGVAAYSSARATFRGNSFVDNQIQVLPQGGRLTGLTWSDQGIGNLWSTYRGFEGLAAGRGAVPHVEGGAVDRLLGRNPELLVLADTPALRMLRSVEERWGRQDPILTDELPITSPLSPPVPAAASPDGSSAAVALGLALLVLPVLLLLLARRSVRRPSRRSLRVSPA